MRKSKLFGPKNYWILGTRFSDEEPVILGANKPTDKPILCSRELAESIASKWSSLPDPDAEKTQPLYKEVSVIQAKTDGKGNWNDPLWCDAKDILTVVRPGHFSAFGKESKLSRHAQMQEKIYGCKGLEWREESAS